MELSILELLMDGSCCQNMRVEAHLLLARPLVVIEMAEPAVVAILAPALGKEATTATEPCKVPE